MRIILILVSPNATKISFKLLSQLTSLEGYFHSNKHCKVVSMNSHHKIILSEEAEGNALRWVLQAMIFI